MTSTPVSKTTTPKKPKAMTSTPVSKTTTPKKPKAITIKTTLRKAPSVTTTMTKLFLSTSEPKLASSKSYETNPVRSTSIYPHVASKDSHPTSTTITSYRSQAYDENGENITLGSHSDPLDDTFHVKTTVKGTSSSFTPEPSSIKGGISGNEKIYIKENLQTTEYNKHNEGYHDLDETSEYSDITMPSVTPAEGTLDRNPEDKSRPDNKKEDIGNKFVTDFPVINIKNRDKLPSDDDSSKSKPKKSFNWLFIVLFIVVPASMVLISVLIWKWANWNQRAKLEGCYKGYENSDCHNEAAICLEKEGSLIKDSKTAHDENISVEMKDRTTETGQGLTENRLTEPEGTGTGVTETAVKETALTETGVTGLKRQDLELQGL